MTKNKRRSYYKVVDPHLNSLMCVNKDGSPNEYNVVYKLNEWVKPLLKDTKLFVFTNLNDDIEKLPGLNTIKTGW